MFLNVFLVSRPIKNEFNDVAKRDFAIMRLMTHICDVHTRAVESSKLIDLRPVEGKEIHFAVADTATRPINTNYKLILIISSTNYIQRLEQILHKYCSAVSEFGDPIQDERTMPNIGPANQKKKRDVFLFKKHVVEG